MKYLVILTLLGVVSSCVTPMGMSPSTIPLENQQTSSLGKTTGSHTQFNLFGFPMPLHFTITHPDINSAVNEALKAKQADALINVHWYTTYYHFILFSTSTIVVEGEAVKIERNTDDPKKK